MVHYKHRGVRSKTRSKYKKTKREKGRPTVNRMLQTFHIGDIVHVNVDPSLHRGMPFRRFVGKTGRIIGKQGSCYLVRIYDMHAEKNIVVHPVHLKLQK
jgi:large subunit ribosomal protein L21e